MRRRAALHRLLASGLLASASWAAALDLRVDATGGPLVLVDQVEAALADWRAAGADPDAVARVVVVRYGDPLLLGPDVRALVVVRPEGEGFEVLVHPEADGVRAALVPALGVVLGGTLGVGALDPRIVPDAPAVPNAIDVGALVAARSDLPGDLDGDGLVGFPDLLRLAAAYGREGVNLAEDLDGDGVVGDGDLDVLRERYTFADAPDDAAAPEVDPAADEPEASDAMDEPDAGDATDATDEPEEPPPSAP
jgi:hypothetical protein